MCRICPICGSKGKYVFCNVILEKYECKYYICDECGFLYTEDPYWLSEAYENAIADTDTGIMSRNIRCVLITNVLLRKVLNKTLEKSVHAWIMVVE